MYFPTFYVPCCDASLEIIKINSYLFDKLYPEAKLVFMGFKNPDYEFYNKNHSFVSLAAEQVGGPSQWTRYIYDYLKDVDDEIVGFMLDDYLLCTEPNREMIKIAHNLLKNKEGIGRFDLTFDCQVEGDLLDKKIKISDYQVALKSPSADYRISTQTSLWKRDYLLKFLNNNWTPWQFEIEGTNLARNKKFREQTLCFYDRSMAHYPIRTIAKGCVSRFNEGKFNVLGMPIELIKDLLKNGFIVKDDLIWGQYKGTPPSFEEKGGFNFHPAFLEYHPTSKTHFKEYYSVYDDEKYPLLTVNLWDTNFVHTKDHPDFGYITSQGEKTPRGKSINYLPFLPKFKEDSEITIFTDKCLSVKTINSVDSKIKIGWIMEPPVVHPDVYKEVESLLPHLDYLLTFSKELSEKYEKCLLFPWCYLRVEQGDWGIHNKDKMYSLIASDKAWAEGHKLRHEVVKNLSDKHSIELWGKGYKEFGSNEKKLALKDYMFSIVIQNCQLDTFFTDICDPMIMGTIPIFWGTKEVSKHFNDDGIIYFDNLQELDKILSNLTEEDYHKRLQAVKDNYEIAKTFWRSDDQLAKFIYDNELHRKKNEKEN